MLVITRKIGQTISIDDFKITITFLGIKGNQARLNTSAPRDIDIHRE